MTALLATPASVDEILNSKIGQDLVRLLTAHRYSNTSGHYCHPNADRKDLNDGFAGNPCFSRRNPQFKDRARFGQAVDRTPVFEYQRPLLPPECRSEGLE